MKQFRGVLLADAMASIRAELGDGAVILATRRNAGGVEVTVALEPDEPVLILPDAPAPAAPPTGPLGFHNLPPWLAEQLAGPGIEQRLAQQLEFAALPDGVTRPLLLAGPPGAGKTLTCAKLAARSVLAGQAPLILTTDGKRAGAAEQLAAFTRLLGLTLALSPNPATLAKALSRRPEGQPALIDTAGCDPLDPAQAAALTRLAEAADAEIVAVIPAGLDPGEAADLAQGFAALGARHLIPTRLDIARRLGGVLAAAAAGKLALSEAGNGPDVAGGLMPLDAATLARLLGVAPRSDLSAP
ncbi:MAG: GTPase [Pseudomonadota bacterium]